MAQKKLKSKKLEIGTYSSAAAWSIPSEIVWAPAMSVPRPILQEQKRIVHYQKFISEKG